MKVIQILGVALWLSMAQPTFLTMPVLARQTDSQREDSSVVETSIVAQKGRPSSEEKTSDQAATTRELSVPPLDHIVYPESRPSWIDGQSTARRLVVQSGPFDDADQARQQLQTLLPAAVRSMALGTVDLMPHDFDPIGDDSMTDFVSQSYVGRVTVGDNPQFESVAEILLEDKDVERFRRRASSVETMHRIAAIGVCTGGGLVMLLGSGGVLGFLNRRRLSRASV